MRAEQVGTSKAYVNVDHIEKERWRHPLVDYDWYAFFQALCEGIVGEDREEIHCSYKDMSRAVGVRKPPKSKKPFGK